ncbi:oxidoreductase [Penicillium riverlandense]|uniref:oxidoreductase n=1 Tax=Penicillium riverlandense TaxID=1903569 RepID=UPI002546AA4B|nr:oxidoreductase [Penicillium riverlandense]KAJ5825315.1 oxidoreductase [Penicillium riverlandense]
MVKAPPIIDFGAFYSCDSIGKNVLVQQIREACQRHGFFQIFNHRVPSDLQESILQQSRDLFSLPLDIKEKYNKDLGTDNRGYERLRAQNFEKRGEGDLKEGFYLGKDLPKDHPSVVAGKFSQGSNKYPSEIRDPGLFKTTIDTYHATLTSLSEDILKVLALTLNLDPNWFEEFAEEPVAILRLLHYPPQKPDASALERGIGAHTDFGAITILLQDDKGGLQVWDRESSQWADVTPVKGALVVNLGNMMMRWSNDQYLSNLHRVINKSGEERYSVPFFFSGNPDFVVKCIPSCTNGAQGAKYPPITVEEWMTARYADTYGGAETKMGDLSSDVEKANN